VALSASVCRDLAAIANGGDDFACVPLQGSGTFAVEAAIGTLVPRAGRVLVAHNGSYGRRIAEICAARLVVPAVLRARARARLRHLPGQLDGADTFRMGCIGAIDAADIARAVAAVAAVLGEISPGPEPGPTGA
jgi:aspartate aminotransferase-like enzyme